MVHLPDLLTRLLRQRGKSAYWLSQYLEVSSATVHRWLHGDATPTPHNLTRLARVLEVPPEVLRQPQSPRPIHLYLLNQSGKLVTAAQLERAAEALGLTLAELLREDVPVLPTHGHTSHSHRPQSPGGS